MKLSLKKKQKAPTGRQAIIRNSNRPATFSYHANRNEQDFNTGRFQPREQDARRRERIIRQVTQRFGLLIVLLVLAVCLIDILHVSHSPKVVALAGSSNDYFLQPLATYQAAADKLFAGSILNDNKVTIDTHGIQQKLRQQFPELADISITLPLIGHRPIIYVVPTAPGVLLKTKTGDFILDGTGKTLFKTSDVALPNSLKIPTVSDQSGLAIRPNTAALPSSSVAFIQSITSELSAKGITITSLTLPNAAYELDVKPNGVPYFIKFNMHNPASALQQVGSFLAVKQRLQQQGSVPASYIDVRLDGRAYYK